MENSDIWERAILEHNSEEYLEAHELFEDLWLELDDRNEKDTVQTLAQADALAVHIQTGNAKAAQRLMRQLPELFQTFPDIYRNTNLKEMKIWISEMISAIPPFGEFNLKTEEKPPKLVYSR